MNVKSSENNRRLVQSIERWAARCPDAVALHFNEEAVTYKVLNLRANRVANAFQSIGVKKGDRVAIMLPNIPEFVYTLVGTLKLGAVAVPFNTLYKGGEVLHILKDSGAKVLVALTNFAPMINEILPDLPDLEHIVVTGERNLLFAQPESTAFIQLVIQQNHINSVDRTYQDMGHVLLKVIQDLGVKEAWYKHRGSIRVRGDKIATFAIFEVENMALINAVTFLAPPETREFLRIVWVPPEIRDKVVEPLTSVQQETGQKPSWNHVREATVTAVRQGFGADIEEGSLARDELFALEKLRTLAYKAR